jgi:hypothetical protein
MLNFHWTDNHFTLFMFFMPIFVFTVNPMLSKTDFRKRFQKAKKIVKKYRKIFLIFEKSNFRIFFKKSAVIRLVLVGDKKKMQITEFRVVFKHFVRCGDKVIIVKRTKHAKVFCRDGKRQNCARVLSRYNSLQSCNEQNRMGRTA